jgi:hypothetical protein
VTNQWSLGCFLSTKDERNAQFAERIICIMN